jgi:hypothetical protein
LLGEVDFGAELDARVGSGEEEGGKEKEVREWAHFGFG